MTPEAQQIAIAESMGKFCSKYVGKENSMNCKKCGQLPLDYIHTRLESFDPLHDLNAMHEAEKVLADENRGVYVNYLTRYTHLDYRWTCAHASAAQRAEAFLRTIGKWEQE